MSLDNTINNYTIKIPVDIPSGYTVCGIGKVAIGHGDVLINSFYYNDSTSEVFVGVRNTHQSSKTLNIVVSVNCIKTFN